MSIPDRVTELLSWLRRRGTKRNRDGMARYGIVAPKVFGVSMATMKPLAKRLGRDHDLALALWETGWYEARILTSFIDEPHRVTAAQMNRWVRDFDNWAVCDSVCFHLFDKSPFAWKKIEQWSTRREEFVKRASFALLASMALHDRTAPDLLFVRSLESIERESTDERNFVKKGVSWALRGIGARNIALNRQALTLAERLAASEDRTARWVGRDALRDLTRTSVQQRLITKERGT